MENWGPEGGDTCQSCSLLLERHLQKVTGVSCKGRPSGKLVCWEEAVCSGVGAVCGVILDVVLL